MTPTDFLLARYAELEALARTAEPGPWTTHEIPWSWSGHSGEITIVLNESADWVIGYDAGPPSGMVSREDATHIAQWDPAFVLADLATKRAIIELAETDAEGYAGLQMAVRLLSQPFATHPDFNPEWKTS